MARLGELPLMAQPGERWLYQSGSQVLGVLASRVAGVGFEEVLRERLLGPLGMNDTGFHTSDTARLEVSDPPNGQWAHPPAFPDGGAGLVSSVDDMVAFGRMLIRGGGHVLQSGTVAEMTRDQLTAAQRANVWPGFSFLDGRGTAWSNVPSQDLTVVVLTQRAADETWIPAVCDEVLAAARATA